MESTGYYFANKHNVDFRSLRFPTIMFPRVWPGESNAAFVNEMIKSAKNDIKYECTMNFPNKEIRVIWMEDAIDAMIKIMELEDKNKLKKKVYDLNGISINPFKITQEIRK